MRRGALVVAVALVLCTIVGGVHASPARAVAACVTTAAPVLQGGTVSPGSGTAATTFTFSVQYSDASNCAPTSATVTVTGATSAALTVPSTTAFTTPVTLTAAIRVPVGTWAYSFTTTTRAKGGVQTVTFTAVSPARVTVAAIPPSPTPKPTPAPTPKPAPSPSPTATPSASPSASPSPSESPTDSTSPSVSIVAVVPGAGGSTGPGATPGTTSSGGPGLALVILLIVCALAGGIGLAVARRRRQRSLNIAPPGNATAVAEVAAADGVATPPGEVMPARWRRSSVQAERASIEAGLIAPPGPARFGAPPQPGEDRRIVAFRLVRVGSDRDDLRGDELTRLDRGDEVRVLEIDRDVARVETPDGTVGWISVATLEGAGGETT